MSDEIENQNEKKVKETIQNNSEILFLYDAKMCNPNGDPDDENKPRMDYDRGINLVSDVRLKRYIRDYLMDYRNETIFVSKVNRETVDATGRLKKLIESFKQEIESNETMKIDLFDKKGVANEKNLSKHLQWLLSKMIDVRFFGATMPLKSDIGKGASITLTGPIQFNWGYSLNKVAGPMESNTITSTFAGAGDEHSTMGKDYRVNYSLIAFHGIISAKRAEHTNLKIADINLFDEAIVQAIPLEATTRSKIGQSPILYIRVNYNTSEYFFGDMRKYVKIIDNNNIEITFDDTAKLRATTDYKIDLSDLSVKLGKINDRITEIYFWHDENLRINGWEIKEGYLFSWDDIPRNENERLIESLKHKFSIDWIKTAKIEKIDNGKTIEISAEKNSLSLRLNNKNTKVNLKIDDGRTDEFIAKTENGKLNIYQEGNEKILKTKSEDGTDVMIPVIKLPKPKNNNPK